MTVDTTIQNHLASPISLRLEQYRVRVCMRFDGGSFRRHKLRPTHLAAGNSNTGIVGHVLGLEGRYTVPAPREQAAEAYRDDALSRIRVGPKNHDRKRWT